jgi:signal transduction histidine kinase
MRRQRRLDAERARFLNEVAHDLRTPLTSLRLYADMLASDRGDAESRGRYAAVIAREAARLTELLANLLDLSRLEHGKRTFDVETLPVQEAVDAAVRDFRALHPLRADDVVVDGDASVTLRGDRSAVARCLANLLDNAGKFTAPGDAIRCAWTQNGTFVHVVVADQGPGVAAEERERIFERYRRGASATDDGVPGTGLGLSLVRELAAGMGGRVTLGHAPRGAVFELTLLRGET